MELPKSFVGPKVSRRVGRGTVVALAYSQNILKIRRCHLPNESDSRKADSARRSVALEQETTAHNTIVVEQNDRKQRYIVKSISCRPVDIELPGPADKAKRQSTYTRLISRCWLRPVCVSRSLLGVAVQTGSQLCAWSIGYYMPSGRVNCIPVLF